MKDKFEIERIDDNMVTVSAETRALIAQAKKLDLRMKRDKVKMDGFKAAVMKAMKENGVKSFMNEEIIITYTPAHTKKALDTKALKEKKPKIFEEFAKESEVAESLRVTFKE